MVMQYKKDQQQQKVDEIGLLFTALATSYSNIISDILNQIDNGTAHQPFYFAAAQEVVNCIAYIRNLEIDTQFLDALNEFCEEIRCMVIDKICELSILEVAMLHTEEDWKLLSNGCTRTQKHFEKHFHVMISNLKQFVTPYDVSVEN
jgi:hypothetical protein